MSCFPSRIEIPIQCYLTAESFRLVRGDSIPDDDHTRECLVSVCNEPLIYSWLFRDLCAGRPYAMEHAAGWLAWMKRGWQESTHFAFVVLDDRGCIVAACDIKTNESDNAEIGYWCSVSARGVMTNAVQAMIDLALQAGFRSFIAYTRTGNHRSERVLGRLGFTRTQAIQADERQLHRYDTDRSRVRDVLRREP